MNVFEAVKQSVTTRQAAEYYNLSVNRANKIACPFHNDRTPSMKVDKRFHCFGCGADGDVIDFIAQLYGLDVKSAANKLAADFQISYEQEKRKETVKKPDREKSEEQMYLELETKCFQVLSDYFHLLRHWERAYAPSPEDAQWHPRFVEALQKKDHIEYLLDVLMCEHIKERAALVRDYGREVLNLEQRLSELSTGAERASEYDGTKSSLPNNRGSQKSVGNERKTAGEEYHAECISGIHV